MTLGQRSSKYPKRESRKGPQSKRENSSKFFVLFFFWGGGGGCLFCFVLFCFFCPSKIKLYGCVRLGSSTFIQTFSGSEVQKQIAGSHGKMKAVYILVHSVVRSFVRSFVPLFVCFSFSYFFLFWPTQCTLQISDLSSVLLQIY